MEGFVTVVFSFLGNVIKFLFKFLLGIFVFGFGFYLEGHWKDWEQMTGVKKVALGFFYVPAALFLMVFTPIWEKM
jgi:hypothetical protein